MAILIIFTCFILVFLIAGIKSGGSSKSEVLLHAVLAFSLLLAIITEALGFFKLISFWPLTFCWLLVAIAGTYYLYSNKPEVINFTTKLKARIRQVYDRLSFYESLLFSIILILFLLEFAQGLIYPATTLDSLTYHMARVASWVGHHSVAPYPTYIPRQLYQPPLAEYYILNINLLNGNDYLSASVQFFFQLFDLVAVVLIARQLGLNRKFIFLAFIFGATIPELVLESSSTQNDLVVSFFVLAAFYFFFKSLKWPGFVNYLFFGLSTGLGIFTKGTAYIFIAPMLLIFGITVLIKNIKKKRYKDLGYAIMLVAIMPLLLNARQYYRNYSSSGNLLGVDKYESELYGVDCMNPELFVCNMAKDADLNIQLQGFPWIARLAGNIVHRLVNATGVNINEKSITFPAIGDLKGIPGDSTYIHGTNFTTHEDYTANFIHIILIWVSLGIIAWHSFKRRNHSDMLLLLGIVILQVLFFCGYLKFQPMGVRLQTPVFLLGLPLICYAAWYSRIFNRIVLILIPVLILYAFMFVLLNNTRPYISRIRIPHGYMVTSQTSISQPRLLQIFSGFNANTAAYKEYDSVNKDIRTWNYKNIGLVFANEGREYPLFMDCYTRNLVPVHILLTNYTTKNKGFSNNVDCIVSTSMRKPFIDYKGKRYYIQDMKNTVLWYYKAALYN